MEVVVGYQGVRVTPLERSRQTEIFSFMGSEVSAEKPKKVLIGGDRRRDARRSASRAAASWSSPARPWCTRAPAATCRG